MTAAALLNLLNIVYIIFLSVLFLIINYYFYYFYDYSFGCPKYQLRQQCNCFVCQQCTDSLAQAHKELQLTVLDVDKHKKLYFDEEHTAHDVRDKAKDIEEK